MERLIIEVACLLIDGRQCTTVRVTFFLDAEQCGSEDTTNKDLTLDFFLSPLFACLLAVTIIHSTSSGSRSQPSIDEQL